MYIRKHTCAHIVYTCVHTYLYTYMNTCVHTYLYTHMNAQICYIYGQTYMYSDVYACMDTITCICGYMLTHACICIYINI